MTDMMTFQDYMNAPQAMTSETKQTLLLLAESHPIIKNHPVLQRMTDEKNSYLSLADVRVLNEAIYSHSIKLAKQMPSSSELKRNMILSEQLVLNTASCVLASSILVQLQASVEKTLKTRG